MNIPPMEGTLTSDAITGTCMDTAFTLSMPGWVDTDGPFNYRFGYYTSAADMALDLAEGTQAR
jgi:hypothetical protein